jgi:hypothetical protein
MLSRAIGVSAAIVAPSAMEAAIIFPSGEMK